MICGVASNSLPDVGYFTVLSVPRAKGAKLYGGKEVLNWKRCERKRQSRDEALTHFSGGETKNNFNHDTCCPGRDLNPEP
jgi:hypothetical protein